MQSPAAVLDEYEKWLERVRSTYESVMFICRHRLGDRQLADQVSAQVVAAMIRKPAVFRYFGLPYSARIGHLAEDRIAAARSGRLGNTANWPDLLRSLGELPDMHRSVFVLACVHGQEIEKVAGDLEMSVPTARELRDEVLRRMRTIGGEGNYEDEGSSPQQPTSAISDASNEEE